MKKIFIFIGIKHFIMKKHYLLSLFLSVIFIVITVYYYDEVSEARLQLLMEMLESGSLSSSLLNNNDAAELTRTAAILSCGFFMAFIVLDFLKLKLQTHKKLSIAGICVSTVFLIWNFLVLSDPGALSFDEVAPAWAGYAALMFVFSLIGIVKLNKNRN